MTSSTRWRGMLSLGFSAAVATIAGPAAAQSNFTLFETGQVRPLAMSPNGKFLFAVNTPDNRLEIFRVKNSGLQHHASVPVGLEPIAVAARNDDEVWVVNHLSDSISIVSVGGLLTASRVVKTLLVGDEPRDIVFAGPGGDLAFITTAHRGQNHLLDPQLTTPGVGRADVWVFDADDLHDNALGGLPINIITLFTDTPRALAASPDGQTVYAAGFHTGNQTTVIPELRIPDGGEVNGGLPNPRVNAFNEPAPETGLIVRFNGEHWVDELGRSWDDSVRFSLPDLDVFAIDAMANPPAQVAGSSGSFAHVGTILFNMAVNPANGKVYVTNTEALNEVRFEGPGDFASTTVRGHLHESRITVLDPLDESVTPRHLNKHIDFSTCCAPVPNFETERSLAQPLDMAFSSDGSTVYVAALGSQKIGIFDTDELENDTFQPDPADHVELTGGGPTGVVLDEARDRLYVLTRFDNGISTIDTQTKLETAHVTMHNPEPTHIVEGRRFLYDARFTSSHGDSSCASCHIFGDFDSLGWDLGNPDIAKIPHPGPFTGPLFDFINQVPLELTFHPMKGPTTTQSLRGMANHGPMHWRGDRTGGNDEPSSQPDSGSLDERAAFEKFQVGFVGLLGRDDFIPAADMEKFTDFILEVTYPPNPIANLDNSLTTDQQAGQNFFFNTSSDFVGTCESCHVTDPNANPTVSAPGFFGTSGTATFEVTPQMMKVPHLRNLYQKVGMFGMAELNPFAVFPGNNGHQGDQIRGFGFTHDGAFDTVFRFMNVVGFSVIFPLNTDGFLPPPFGDPLRRQVEDFLLAFASNLAPIVGQQVTLTPENQTGTSPRIDLLIQRADAGECDLVAKATLLGNELGFLYVGSNQFTRDRASQPPINDNVLRSLALLTQTPITYTCVPLGSGERIGIDRDGDGFLDGDEEASGSDPADPSSTP